MKQTTRLERHAPAVLLTAVMLIAALLIGSLYLGPSNPEALPKTHLRITEVTASFTVGRRSKTAVTCRSICRHYR